MGKNIKSTRKTMENRSRNTLMQLSVIWTASSPSGDEEEDSTADMLRSRWLHRIRALTNGTIRCSIDLGIIFYCTVWPPKWRQKNLRTWVQIIQYKFNIQPITIFHNQNRQYIFWAEFLNWKIYHERIYIGYI